MTNKKFMRRINRKRGAVIAEGAAALALLLPVLMIVIFVALEVSFAYLMKSSMSEAAREAARSLSIAYGLDPSIADSGKRPVQNQKVFDTIRITNIINASEQFDDPIWNTASDPPTVTVNVRYLGNQYGLPPFPNPDPLNLGSTFQITGNATYRLQ